MNKNNPKPIENEKDEFDQLLEELLLNTSDTDDSEIKDDLGLEENEQLPFEWTTVVDNGTEYKLPSHKSPIYTFRELELALLNQRFDLMKHTNRFYSTSFDTYYSFSFIMDNISIAPLAVEREAISMILYREGEGGPIDTYHDCAEYSDFRFDIEGAKSQLPTGKYFLLIRNAMPADANDAFDVFHGLTRYRFSVLQHGETLLHPTILNISMKRCSSDYPYMSGGVNLDISLTNKQLSNDELTFYCYTDNMHMMGKKSVAVYTDISQNCNHISLQLGSEYVWMPGGYFVVLEHNGEPFYRFDFQYNTFNVEIVSQGVVERMSSDYILTKYLETRHSSWNALHHFYGVADLKNALLKGYRFEILNEMRQKMELPPIPVNVSYAFSLKSNDYLEKALRCFSKCLAYNYALETVDCAKLLEPKNTMDPFEEIDQLLDASCSTIFVLKHITSLFSGSGQVLLQRFEKRLLDKNISIGFFVIGTPVEVATLMDQSPVFAHNIPLDHRMTFGHVGLSETIFAIQDKLGKLKLKLSSEATNLLVRNFVEEDALSPIMNWNMTHIEDFVQTAIIEGYSTRILSSQISITDNTTADLLNNIEIQDLRLEHFVSTRVNFDESLTQLQQMVGLAGIKKQIVSTFNALKLNNERKRFSLPVQEDTVHHMIFTGNPGTGKTTVAKMIGSIYHSLGLLSVGDVIVTERSKLVGRYLGETEKNVQNVLEQARGNVLFIDEAYTLFVGDDDRRDFGNRVIESLLTILAQKHTDMLVIMAGYQDDMSKMMAANQGLAGRFPHTLHFDDYTAEELMRIADLYIANRGYTMTNEARSAFNGYIQLTVSCNNPYFSNARWIEQYIQSGVLPAMADRIMQNEQSITKELLQLIEKVDVDLAFRKFEIRTVGTEKVHNPIGFRA